MMGVVIITNAAKAEPIFCANSLALKSDTEGWCSTCASIIASSTNTLELGAVAISRMKTDAATAADEIISAASQ